LYCLYNLDFTDITDALVDLFLCFDLYPFIVSVYLPLKPI